MSPAYVHFLLRCHWSPEPHQDSPVNKEAASHFIALGAIDPHSDKERLYRCTKLGRAWVRAICDTPIPRQVFLDASGQEISI